MSDKIKIHGHFFMLRRMEVTAVAVICAPTGVVCEVQAGGDCIEHPSTEGYYMTVYTERPVSGAKDHFMEGYKALEDCGHGYDINGKCWQTNYPEMEIDKEEVKKDKREYAVDIDIFLKNDLIEYYWSWANPVRFTFDYDRMDEVMDGWWPVLIELQTEAKKLKGYLHFSNGKD